MVKILQPKPNGERGLLETDIDLDTFTDENGEDWRYVVDGGGHLHRWLASQPPVALVGPNGQDVFSDTAIQVPQVDFSVEWVVVAASYSNGGVQGLGGQQINGLSQRGWSVRLEADGDLRVFGSADGATSVNRRTTATIYTADIIDGDRIRVKADFRHTGTEIEVDLAAHRIRRGHLGDLQPRIYRHIDTVTLPIANLANLQVRPHIGSTSRDNLDPDDGNETFDGVIDSMVMTVANTPVAAWPKPADGETWTTNGTSLTAPDESGSEPQRVSVVRDWNGIDIRDYPDGEAGQQNAAVDTAALQWALDHAFDTNRGAVLIPAATVLRLLRGQSDGCIHLRPGVAIIGQDLRSSIVQLADGLDDTGGVLRAFTTPAGGADDVTLENFTIDGNRANLGVLANAEQQHGVFLQDSDGVRLRGMSILNCQGDGVYYHHNTRQGSVQDCTLVGNYRVGINVTYMYRGIVSGNTIEGITGTPYTAEAGIKAEVNDIDTGFLVGYHTIVNNTTETLNGIAVSGNSSIIYPGMAVTGNVIQRRSDGNASEGLVAANTSSLHLGSNTVTGFEQGIKLNGGCADFVVDANTVEDDTATPTSQFFAGIHIGGSTAPTPNIGGVIADNSVKAARGITINENSNNLPMEDINVSGNRVIAVTEALYVASGRAIKVFANALKTSAGDRAVRLRELSTALENIDVSHNDIIGGAVENVLLEDTATSVAFQMMDNRFEGAPIRVTGSPSDYMKRSDSDTVLLPNGFGTAAPASGDHSQGDVIWNSSPAAGGVVGWVCVASGTPGTWKSFGTIEA